MRDLQTKSARLKADARDGQAPERSRFKWTKEVRDRESMGDGKLSAARGIALALLLSAAIWIGIVLLLR